MVLGSGSGMVRYDIVWGKWDVRYDTRFDNEIVRYDIGFGK